MCNQDVAPDPMAHVFQGKPGECGSFIVNNYSRRSTTVTFQNQSYHLPRGSISILPDCRNELYNTAKDVIPNFEKTSLEGHKLLGLQLRTSQLIFGTLPEKAWNQTINVSSFYKVVAVEVSRNSNFIFLKNALEPMLHHGRTGSKQIPTHQDYNVRL
ncbi:hypothetical protein NE237_000417 [Protea cynaroides]|uniref:Beta-galactosidase beta-sandwich domain-containing protein n=1 Tax=Protea cynaroides TaxID=273540 RepID=A0A9Q0KRE0_9MAGN|nr:hypothetical protein NE237_000417 [Protea cynaroides]